MPKIREVSQDEVTLEQIQSAGLRLKEATSARESAALVLKAAKEAESSARNQLDLLVGAREEVRPLLEESEACN